MLIKQLVVFTRFVQNGIDFLYHVKISLIVGVFNTSPSPWDIRQLTCGQHISNVTTP